jgi:hypothetical protein
MKAGREFQFMVKHLARTDAEARKDQAKLLNKWSEQQTLPVLAVGDYNLDAEDGDEGDRDPVYESPAGKNWESNVLVGSQCVNHISSVPDLDVVFGLLWRRHCRVKSRPTIGM